jgi:hypothetical protein
MMQSAHQRQLDELTELRWLDRSSVGTILAERQMRSAWGATPTRVTSGNHVCTNTTGCRTGYPVEFCSFNGGHTPDPSDGGTSWQYQVVWNFFNQF